MKRIICLLFVITAIGCAKKPIMLTTPCPVMARDTLAQQLVGVLLSEGFEIRLLNEKLGLIQAETAPDYSIWTGMTTVNKWSITIREDRTVEAYASSYMGSQNIFGATNATSMTPYDDRAHESHTWYWSVRNRLESLCGNRVEFYEGGKRGEASMATRGG
jgi:hypothetical protein